MRVLLGCLGLVSGVWLAPSACSVDEYTVETATGGAAGASGGASVSPSGGMPATTGGSQAGGGQVGSSGTHGASGAGQSGGSGGARSSTGGAGTTTEGRGGSGGQGASGGTSDAGGDTSDAGGDTSDAGAGGAAPLCSPGAKRCDGPTVLQCESGQWVQATPCSYACTGEGVCSGECAPGGRDCVGTTPRECDELGEWHELTACPDACTGAGNCVGACVPNTKDCLGKVPRQCNASGAWAAQAACTYVCSGSGVCSGSCVPGDRDCSGATPRLCSATGAWVTEAVCPFVCGGEGVCGGVCVPGDRDCAGATPRLCSAAGVWVNETTCPFVCGGKGVCGGTCVPQSRACSGAQPQQCNSAGAWVKESACTGSTPNCYAGTCSACPGTQGPTMVKVPAGFCIDSTEVTNAQYAEFLAAKGSSTSGQSAQCSGWNTTFAPSMGWPATAARAEFPVNWVDWCDAETYCAWAGKRLCGKVGGGGVPNDVTRGEASVNEWINACSAGGTQAYPYGSTYVAGLCNNFDYAAQHAVIAVKQASQCMGGYNGIYDMIGNVYEWINACDGAHTGTIAADNACYIVGSAYYRNAANSLCSNMGYVSERQSAREDVGFRCCAP